MAVAGRVEVRLWSHGDLKAHLVGHAPDRLQHRHALVCRRERRASSSPTESSKFPCPTSAWHCSGLRPISFSVSASSAIKSAAVVSAKLPAYGVLSRGPSGPHT